MSCIVTVREGAQLGLGQGQAVCFAVNPAVATVVAIAVPVFVALITVFAWLSLRRHLQQVASTLVQNHSPSTRTGSCTQPGAVHVDADTASDKRCTASSLLASLTLAGEVGEAEGALFDPFDTSAGVTSPSPAGEHAYATGGFCGHHRAQSDDTPSETSSHDQEARQTEGDWSHGVLALLKARSDMAVLRDLKLGPLLGKGSFAKVFKGRWNAVTVAVKIIKHPEKHDDSEDAATTDPGSLMMSRASLLATAVAHPNVVQTYHISTMKVSQRKALADAWLEASLSIDNPNDAEPAESTTKPSATQDTIASDVDKDEPIASSTLSDSDEDQQDVLETWFIMEYCEKGSLDRAIARCRFIRKEDGKPEMIGVYKALLDTASGLDYLHSIGIIHGDLNPSNILLRGSTRDARGFACKIADFALSRVLDLDATHVSTETYGTIVYMPPELLLSGHLTQATDIYSFGLIMWELYTSTRVFKEGLSIGQIFYMIAYQGWRPEVPSDCPAGYAALMQACWHQDPEQRPTVQEVLRTLQQLYIAEKEALAADPSGSASSDADTAAADVDTHATAS